jgi:hypothetical protein
MPVFNAHGLDAAWAEPSEEEAQKFFDNLTEKAIRVEDDLIRDTTEEEVAYIATRAEEANLATAVLVSQSGRPARQMLWWKRNLPIDLLLYKRDRLTIDRYRRLGATDPDLNLIHASWESSLRRAVEQLPEIDFNGRPETSRPG